MKFLAVILALVAVATAAKPSKYRRERELHPREVRGICAGPLRYRCASGECIDAEWECDTEQDCSDNSDEANCTSGCTGPHRFQCAQGHCIASEFRCDGLRDCDDDSDEKGCHDVQCSAGEAKCANDVCVEQRWFCDGEDDCGDGSDEANCPTRAACFNKSPVSACTHLNQTSSPICLDHNRAVMFCKQFCNLCGS